MQSSQVQVRIEARMRKWEEYMEKYYGDGHPVTLWDGRLKPSKKKSCVHCKGVFEGRNANVILCPECRDTYKISELYRVPKKKETV